MSHVARQLLRIAGIDRAIGFTVLGRAWLSFAGLVSLALVGKCLSPAEQGFYYTFGSLVALQVFVELGLTNVIMQFASHERAALSRDAKGILTGSAPAKSRLAGLLRLAMCWYGAAAAIFVVALLMTGFAFFTRCGPVGVSWQFPWVGTVLATAGTLVFMPILAFLDGCGLVADVAKFRMHQAMVANAVLWLALLAGAGLVAVPLFACANLAVSAAWLFTRQRTLLVDLWRYNVQERLDWRNEIWPYQWRIALSWLSGYCVFQLFTPVLFAFHGPTEAGRMGMGLTLAGAVSSLGASWLTTKAPHFGVLVSQGRFRELDSLFTRSLSQAVCVAILAATAVLGLALILRAVAHPLADRLLPPWPLGLLLLTSVINIVVLGEAVYLRAFKREPFLSVSLLNAILIGSWTCLAGRTHGALGMMVGYPVISTIVGLGLGSWVFVVCRREWHAEFHGKPMSVGLSSRHPISTR